MSYDIEVIRESQHKTSEWSGGTTTELYIYPLDSLYTERNFKWRMSSAKVEIEKSIFTSLQGICRHIMVIEGQLLLKHEGHYNVDLKEFEQDSFSGDWTTKSVGKVTDFNLMLAKGYKGKLEEISVNTGEPKDINVNYSEIFSTITDAFYIVKGEIDIDTGINEKTSLISGDLAIITRTGQEIIPKFKIHNRFHEESKIIKASIFYCE